VQVLEHAQGPGLETQHNKKKKERKKEKETFVIFKQL
jgi:hypothetical protein